MIQNSASVSQCDIYNRSTPKMSSVAGSLAYTYVHIGRILSQISCKLWYCTHFIWSMKLCSLVALLDRLGHHVGMSPFVSLRFITLWDIYSSPACKCPTSEPDEKRSQRKPCPVTVVCKNPNMVLSVQRSLAVIWMEYTNCPYHNSHQ